MDPVTHTMVGATIAAAGWRRRTALATPAAIIAANVPDVDVLSYVNGEYAALAFRRGWTHGPPALLLLAVLVLLLMFTWHGSRRVRPDRENVAAPPLRAAPLLLLVGVSILTHPLLDWMNTYGLRWLMPFDRRWYYGDSLFIIDPWIWLLLGVPLFLLHSASRRGLALWALFAAVSTLLVLGTGAVPITGRIVWVVGLLTAIALRLRTGAPLRGARSERVAFLALGVTSLYIAAMVASNVAGARIVARSAVAQGIEATAIMVAPEPGNPFGAGVVVRDAEGYWLGRLDWLGSPRLRLRSERVPTGTVDAVVRAAAATTEASDYLTWSRFPIVRTSEADGGFVVRFTDARYLDGRAGGSLAGVTVRLDSELRPLR